MSTCQAVEAVFAWWTQTCGQPAVGEVVEDGVAYPACGEHGGAA